MLSPALAELRQLLPLEKQHLGPRQLSNAEPALADPQSLPLGKQHTAPRQLGDAEPVPANPQLCSSRATLQYAPAAICSTPATLLSRPQTEHQQQAGPPTSAANRQNTGSKLDLRLQSLQDGTPVAGWTSDLSRPKTEHQRQAVPPTSVATRQNTSSRLDLRPQLPPGRKPAAG